jgi:hypothetical protein
VMLGPGTRWMAIVEADRSSRSAPAAEQGRAGKERARGMGLPLRGMPEAVGDWDWLRQLSFAR